MSGIVGSCIVCGAFHATGHIGDEYVLLRLAGDHVLACPKCIPFAPKPERDTCKVCGSVTVRYIYPPDTWGREHDYGWTCAECEDAKRHVDAHKRMEMIAKAADQHRPAEENA